MRALRELFLSMMNRIPLLEYDRYPLFPMFNMSIKILVWNVQGVGNKVPLIRELVRINKPSVLVLVETHISGDQAQKICDKIGFMGQQRVEAQGFSGGIWMLWDTNTVTITSYGSHSQHITVEVRKVGEDPWLFSAVYASPDSTLRKELWKELEKIKDDYSGPWLLAGDFNETMSMTERNGVESTEMMRRCREFSNWVNNNELINSGCSGPNHTWFRGNSSDTFKSARLDRGLANEDWRMRFCEGAVRNLPKAASDHCPIIVSTNGFSPIPMVTKPFRFQAAWLNQARFHEFVYENWKTTAPVVPFLREFASKLQKWNREEFYNIFRKKSELWARLEGVQSILASGRQSHLVKLEAKLRREMDDVLNEEELLWFQKSRMEAIKDGDRNTRYFHLSTLMRRRRNRIDTLMDSSGNWIHEEAQVKGLISQYWNALFQEDGETTHRNGLLWGCFPNIPAEDMEKISRPFTSCEVVAALKDMQPFKAPGPDGFQPIFFQRFWEVVQPNVTQLVKDVLEGRDFPTGLNDAFLVLIPKVDVPQSANQFRPIGLCNIVYKLVTKVIVNRLKPILPALISPTQCSFVPKRQITDNIIIVQEMIHSMRYKQGRAGYMAIKIDFEKAYDRLRWTFIRESLMELSLPQKMIEVVMNCITSAKLSILWNGEPLEAFQPTRGIRQGDPLSPYLYVICMERLSHLIEREVQLGHWKPTRASRNGPPITNLAFVDDLILFGEASVEQAEIMMTCLNQFCEASGSKVSIAKSRVFFSKNTNFEIRQAICSTLGMDETEDLGKYLGVPIINGRSSKREYQYLVDKINGKLAGWKMKSLSLAGRATLVQSAISSIPFYTMQTTKLPRSTCDELDRKSRSFLWGSNEGERKVHMVSWNQISKPKHEGGLGISQMRQANSAFLAKLGWRLLAEPSALWSRLLRAKYCDNRCDLDMFKDKQNASNTWRGIMSSVDIVRKGVNMAVGNGHKTFFWHHRWVIDKPLIEVARIGPPVHLQDATVREMWDRNTGWRWEIFANFLHKEELGKIAAQELMEDDEAADEIFWNGAPSGGFTLASALKIIRNDLEVDIDEVRGWKSMWSVKAPQRVRFFIWLASQDRLMSNGNRFIRRMTDDPRCFVCGEIEENTIHILRDCLAAKRVWRLLGVQTDDLIWRIPLRDWLLGNIEKRNLQSDEGWPTLFSVTCWWLWRWRNERSFNAEPRIPIDQVSFVFARVKEVRDAFLRDQCPNSGHGGTRQEILVKWQCPSVGWVKLNTDGASKGNPGKAGAGGVIRGHRGEVFEMFAMNCGECSCTRAELLAVMRGLIVAWNGGHKTVIVSVDSEVVVHLLEGDPPTNSPYIHIIRKCNALIRNREWEVKVEHCYREANRAADWLANFGVSLEVKFELIEAVPKDLRAVLLEDLGGVSWPRMAPAKRMEK